MASTEMFAGIALQRLLLGMLAVILAVVWTVLFWPAVLPVLETLSGAEVIDGSAQSVAEAGLALSLRFSAAALLTMAMPVLACKRPEVSSALFSLWDELLMTQAEAAQTRVENACNAMTNAAAAFVDGDEEMLSEATAASAGKGLDWFIGLTRP